MSHIDTHYIPDGSTIALKYIEFLWVVNERGFCGLIVHTPSTQGPQCQDHDLDCEST